MDGTMCYLGDAQFVQTVPQKVIYSQLFKCDPLHFSSPSWHRLKFTKYCREFKFKDNLSSQCSWTPATGSEDGRTRSALVFRWWKAANNQRLTTNTDFGGGKMAISTVLWFRCYYCFHCLSTFYTDNEDIPISSTRNTNTHKWPFILQPSGCALDFPGRNNKREERKPHQGFPWSVMNRLGSTTTSPA